MATNTADSSTEHTGNGSTTSFSISFTYLSTAEIDVKVNNVVKSIGSDYTISGQTLTFSSAPSNGHVISIKRDTNIGQKKVDFEDGSVLTETDLDNNTNQLLFGIQEIADDYVKRDGSQTITGDIVFEGSVDDANETTLSVTNPTADRTITVPDVTGTIVTTGDTGTVTSTMINNGTIVNADINSSANIAGTKLADDSVTLAKLGSGALPTDITVASANIVDGTIVNGDIANTTITGGKLANDTITSTQIGANAVTASELANDAVDTNAIQDGGVTRAKIAADAIDGTKIENDAIANEHIADLAVGNAQLGNVSVGTTKLQTGAVTNNKIADNSVNAAKLGSAAVTTAKLAPSSVTGAKLAQNSVGNNALNTNAVATENIQNNAVTAAKIADETIITSGEQASATVDNATFFTTAAAEARYFNASTGETIKDGQTFPDNDTTIATTAAINDRIIDLVDEVGGFVPIANETSFPTTNPDVNNGTGTIVSVATASTNLTPSGTTVTIANGAGSGNTVTITGVPSVISSGFGFLVETTTTLHTYTFHRLVPKATEVTTVATNATQVQTVHNNINNINAVANNATNINAVAADASDIGAVAGKATEIGRLGTADAVADMALLGTTDVVADMNLLATSDVISDMNTLAVADVISDMNTLAVSDVISDMNDLATSGNITAMSTCSTNISSITNASNNISSVNNFGDKYQVASSDPTTDGGGNALAAGDLYFNTSANELKVYTGSQWQGGVTATGNFATVTGNTFTGSNRYNNNLAAIFGTSTNSHAFSIKHDGNNGLINNGTGTLFYMGGNHRWVNNGVSQNIAWFQEDGFVKLYYDGGTETLATTANGINVYGSVHTFLASGSNCDLRVIRSGGCFLTIQSQTNKSRITTGANNHTLELGTNGSGRILIDDSTIDLPQDNQRLRIGAGNDLQLYHTGTANHIDSVNGALAIRSDVFQISTLNGTHVYLNIPTNEQGVELYFDNSKKFETVSAGCKFAHNIEIQTSGTKGIIHTGYNIIDQRFDTSNYDTIQFKNGAGTVNYCRIGYQTAGGTPATSGILRLEGQGSLGEVVLLANGNSFNFNKDGHFTIGDNQYIKIGANQDLQIYHDGNHSYISDQGTGRLKLATSYLNVVNAANNENIIEGLQDGQVNLYYDGGTNPKLSTTSNGVDVTGTLECSSTFTCGGLQSGTQIVAGNPALRFRTLSNSLANASSIEFYYNTSNLSARIRGKARNGSNGQIYLDVEDGGTLTNIVYVHDDGLDLTQGHLDIPNDTYKLRLGESADLQLFHTGSYSNIYNSTGDLDISSDVIRLKRGNRSETFASFIVDGQAEFHYDGGSTPKAQTYSNGFRVNGRLNFDSDTDTFIDRPNSNQIEVTVANKEVATFIDGSNNRPAMLIDKGQANNDAGGANYNSNGNANDLVVGNVASGNHGITICTPSDATGTLNFSDGSGAGQDAYKGSVSYDHTNEVTVLRAKSGNVALRRNAVDTLLATSSGVTITGNVLPEANNSRDLGSTSLRWANVYTNDLNLSNEGGSNDVDGTWGSYTIQEGAEDLFLINKRSGKKYKFALTEVS
jgi:hypothetical protein